MNNDLFNNVLKEKNQLPLLFVIFTLFLINFYNSDVIQSVFFLPLLLLLIIFYTYNNPVEGIIIIITLGCNMGVLFDTNSVYMPGVFKFQDVMFMATFIPVIFNKRKEILDKDLKKFILYLLLFTLFYSIITHIISFKGNMHELFKSLLYYRFLAFWLSIIPVYIVISKYDNYSKAIFFLANVSLFITLLILIQYFFPQLRISKQIIEGYDFYTKGYYNFTFIIPGWGYLQLFQFIGLGLFLSKGRKRYIGLLLFFLIGLVIILASGRTALGKMAFSTFFFIILLGWNSKLKIKSRLFYLITFAILLLIIDIEINLIGIINYIENLVYSGTIEMRFVEGTWAVRILSHPFLFELFLKSPFIGNGVLDTVMKGQLQLYQAAIVDNGLLGLLVLFGFIGTVILLLPYFKVLKMTYLIIKQQYIQNLTVITIEKIYISALASFVLSQLLFFWTFSGNIFGGMMFEGMYLWGVYLAFFVVSFNRSQKYYQNR